MAKRSARNLTRARIAQIAARLMAADGVTDYATAKRKAAREAGVEHTRELPNNDEIDAALHVYRSLYQSDHPAQLRELRALALEIMDEYARFTPYLTGSVLTGTAGKYADIQLQLFTDTAKAVEFDLLSSGIDFVSGDAHLYAGDMPLTVPLFSFTRDNIGIHLTVLSPRELRAPLKTSPEGKSLVRAKRDAVAALLATGA